jgi:hypothetical protein
VSRTVDRTEPAHSDADETLAERVVDAAIAAELETGRREETVEEARRSVLRRMARIVAGSFLVLAGLLMWVLPGPGLLTIAAGLLVLSRDFPWAARMLERVRARLPQDEAGQTHRGVVVASITLAVLSIGGSLAFLLV